MLHHIKNNSAYWCAVCLILLVSTNNLAWANKPHVHGLTQMMVATSDAQLDIWFEFPATDIVGFEVQASSDEHLKTIENARTILEQVSVVTAGCQLTDANVDMGTLLPDGHDHSHHDHNNHKHREITVVYQYQCPSLNKMKITTTDLFEQFPAIHTIQAQWVTDTDQGSQSLTVDQPSLNF